VSLIEILRRTSFPVPLSFLSMEELQRGGQGEAPECSRLAGELGLDPTTLVARSALENMERTHPATPEEIEACGPLMNWQARLLAPGIRRILSSRGHGPHSRVGTGGEQPQSTRPVIPTNAEGSPGTQGVSRSARKDTPGKQ